jgi:hypothetical protein
MRGLLADILTELHSALEELNQRAPDLGKVQRKVSNAVEYLNGNDLT